MLKRNFWYCGTRGGDICQFRWSLTVALNMFGIMIVYVIDKLPVARVRKNKLLVQQGVYFS